MPVPPKSVQRNAAKGLELRRKFKRGGTNVGVARARNLSNGDDIPSETIARMRSYFARHAVDAKAEGWESEGDPSAGWIAWLLWGGDSGRRWANSFREDGEGVDRFSVVRFDGSALDPALRRHLNPPTPLPDGGWRVEGIAAVAGVKMYGNRAELATYDALTAHLDRFDGLKTTPAHLDGILTPDNPGRSQGTVLRAEGIPEAQALKIVMRLDSKDGPDGLSVGWSPVEVEHKPGVHKGVAYDYVQTHLVPNHVGRVHTPRSRGAGLRLDQSHPKPPPRSPAMPSITINGLTQEVDPAFASAFLAERDANKARLDEATDAFATALARAEKAEGEAEGLKANRMDEDAINARVNARVALITEAKGHLPADARLDGKTDREIREAVIKAKMPAMAERLDGTSDDFVSGLYSAAIATKSPATGGGATDIDGRKPTPVSREDGKGKPKALGLKHLNPPGSPWLASA